MKKKRGQMIQTQGKVLTRKKSPIRESRKGLKTSGIPPKKKIPLHTQMQVKVIVTRVIKGHVGKTNKKRRDYQTNASPGQNENIPVMMLVYLNPQTTRIL